MSSSSSTGLPVDLAEQVVPGLPFLGPRLSYRATAVSCFPSTTGPAYFPFLAGCSPGRANVPGIRWFDRTCPTRSAFPHRGLRSYVGPDARRLATDTRATTLFRETRVAGVEPDSEGPPEARRAQPRPHVGDGAFHAPLGSGRSPNVMEAGARAAQGTRDRVRRLPVRRRAGAHVRDRSERPNDALEEIDRQLARKLESFEGEILLSADHGLTDTHTHIDLQGIVEKRVGTTIAFPLITRRFPEAVVCESGNAMANVYLRGAESWSELPSPGTCRALAAHLLEIEGIDSVAIRSEDPHRAELWTGAGVGYAGFTESGLFQEGTTFAASFESATPSDALDWSATERHPDAAFALSSLFASERAGDLLVSASPGFDLRAKGEWPEHHASHGGLHADHTVVPVLSSAPLPAQPLRTLDLFARTLELAGVPLAEYPESDAARIELGSWRPEVWR